MIERVVATAGHVDHGKSALVRALTGLDTDRWAEEKRRGLTIDLGFAWSRLPSGREVSFVDVPGHERFLGNMLAGLGPAPIVCFVVAADEGWQAQSDDHRDAVAALGIDTGLLVITRADLAEDGPEGVEAVVARARAELASTGLAHAPLVITSARTGQGIEELRTVLDGVLERAPEPSPDAPLRLWVDRSFTITGAGTVVTGTLANGTLREGDRLHLIGAEGAAAGEGTPVTVRGLQSRERPAEALGPVCRAAINLRGIDAGTIARGDALVTPGAFEPVAVVDVRRCTGALLEDVPREAVVHAGSAAVPARVRGLGPEHARITLERALPLRVGDRVLLRGSGEHAVLGGARILDVDPPELTRRGDGGRRARTLATISPVGDVVHETARRGAIREDRLRRMGVHVPDPLPAAVRRLRDWLVDVDAIGRWASTLRDALTVESTRDPLSPGISRGAALDLLGLPDGGLLEPVLESARLVQRDGRIADPDAAPGLGAVEPRVATLESRLRSEPFRAPEADDLAALDLGARELAAAEAQGRLLRLPDGVVLLPSAPALAMRELARLDQPFTLSAARQALGTTRRVAVPLLEHLDDRGWTRRVDGSRREVVR
ncbi:selenocysteine-specific translation elongation factor [Brachybacterium endophyticum]|uniref:Selenocysteine-specific translation elongation factor n=1 Tax=Brachybacterium endophyticum TaxID=2182385 RepID=A0A2U2RLE7_9MICO|nr:selenocysteine-specific translation elongation factor [Brachybacterium endophyticum]PWH06690.1 selenocysteine-specific translation elongation factor [Brachybacterium endophyticum]